MTSNFPDLTFWAALACGLMGAVALLWSLARLQRERKIFARLRMVTNSTDDHDVTSSSEIIVDAIRSIGQIVINSKFISTTTCKKLSDGLVSAGYKSERALALFISIKIITISSNVFSVLMTATLLNFRQMSHLLLYVGTTVFSFFLPDWAIRSLRRRYITQLESGLGDALDLLVICVEAGLPLESGLDRVAADFRVSNPATAREFQMIAREMKILPDRRQAVLNAGTRTGVDGLTKLGATLSQSMQYGTPLAQALRTLAVESRAAVLNRFEARAARLPVMLTLPMILFILPCLFIVIGTPAIVQALGGLAR